jgi:acyl-CoA thioesterase FadM
MTQEVRRGDDILAKGVIRAASLNKQDKPARLPKIIMEKLTKG